jgi:hypothetical protein
MLLSALTIDYLPGLDCRLRARRFVALLPQKQGRKGGESRQIIKSFQEHSPQLSHRVLA